ncbi:protein trichome birefringence-like 25 isoform X2 [Silene latifolia]|uniref:protein trichome birefringence-like 25 isoform X2 n=1 Tax=Silene latifolia TaxID=37657 RepID=UPI003D789D22
MKRETTPLVKQPLPLSSSFSNQNNPIYVQLLYLILLLSLTIFLYSTFSIDHSSSSPFQTPTSIAHNSQQIDLLVSDANNGSQSSSPSPSPSKEVSKHEAKPKCDLFKGDWVPNPNGPTYNNTCRFTEFFLNCQKNGRPDNGYQFWRWKPKECELSGFDSDKFLNLMRNKGFAFIGDSILRNQMKSLLCLLSQVEEATLISEDENKKASKWFFPSYNFTLQGFWTPYLIKAEINDDSNGVAKTDVKLHLDKLDNTWTTKYGDFDYVMIGSGPWFTRTNIYHENNRVIGCHNCPAGQNLTELGLAYSYHKALNLALEFITSSSHRPQAVFFRTVTPSHFESGKWDEGGRCDRKVPVFEKRDQISLSESDRILYQVEKQEFDKAISRVGVTADKRVTLRLFDSTFLSSLRPDGHPAKYAYPLAKDKYDCLHWCLPGPIDTWNEIMFKMLTNI